MGLRSNILIPNLGAWKGSLASGEQTPGVQQKLQEIPV